MSSFWQSTSGRLVTFAVGLALAGGGSAALLGGVAGVALLGTGFLVGIALTIIGVALSLEEHPGHAAGLLIGLPFALFLFAFGQLNMAKQIPSMGYLLVVLGLGAIARAVFAGSVGEKAEHRSQIGAH